MLVYNNNTISMCILQYLYVKYVYENYIHSNNNSRSILYYIIPEWSSSACVSPICPAELGSSCSKIEGKNTVVNYG